MKNILSIVVFLFLSLVNFAQKDNTENTKAHKFGISLNQSITRYGLPTAILLTLHQGKHQIDIGPQFRLGRSFNSDQKNLGLEFNYRCYLAGDQHWFSSYVLFNLGYFHEYSAYKSTIYNSSDPNLNGQSARKSEAFDNIALNGGYGVKFRLAKSVYLGSNIGIGYLSSLYTSKTQSESGDFNHISKSRDGYLGFLGSIYIGYKF